MKDQDTNWIGKRVSAQFMTTFHNPGLSHRSSFDPAPPWVSIAPCALGPQHPPCCTGKVRRPFCRLSRVTCVTSNVTCSLEANVPWNPGSSCTERSFASGCTVRVVFSDPYCLYIQRLRSCIDALTLDSHMQTQNCQNSGGDSRHKGA